MPTLTTLLTRLDHQRHQTRVAMRAWLAREAGTPRHTNAHPNPAMLEREATAMRPGALHNCIR